MRQINLEHTYADEEARRGGLWEAWFSDNEDIVGGGFSELEAVQDLFKKIQQLEDIFMD